MTITGTNLTGATTVKFGASAATSFTVNSSTQITAAAPAGTGHRRRDGDDAGGHQRDQRRPTTSATSPGPMSPA